MKNFLVIILIFFLSSCTAQSTDALYSEKHVYVHSSDSLLQHGIFFMPKHQEAKKIPCVVIGHGSAPSTLENVGYYTNLAKRMGFAVLAYDKRGTGQSEGLYESFGVERSQACFDLLSDDMSAFVNWAKAQPEVDTNRIGLLGGSQAGWIMPLTASKSPVRFIIIGEGTPLSAGEENYFSSLTDDRLDGPLTIAEADKKLQNFKGEKGFDSRAILSKVDASIMWIFGTQDPVIPVDASIRALEKMQNPMHEIVVLKNGNHDFVDVTTNEPYDLLEHIKPWLHQLGVL